MSVDVLATYSSPNAVLTGPEAVARLRLSMQAGPICLVPRIIPLAIAAVLDRADPDDIPTCDVSGPRLRIEQAVAAACAIDGRRTTSMIRWLRDDVLALIELYAEATRASSIRVRLLVVADDVRRSFHVGAASFRLVTTYRGAGTEWIPPRVLALTPAGQPLDPGSIRQLDRGTVAILRGGKDATIDRPGVLHRSPAVAGSTRLFLSIDKAGV